MDQTNIYGMVDRYLRDEISQADLQRWIWHDSWAWEDAPCPEERDLASTALHFGWILESGEWTEESFRRELELEYQEALKQRPSPVS